ncbi:alpha/beta-hydrolase [Rhizoclosmatium globosum]|uniref:Alpha/beta-hydrolase n=1 Tax=Rhizoclosmatium globosum TaxID=329046 RepID=A0A1Y2CF90_9FUNG|nr:alpha/beta-hydrolase [Rhizoclosmatium globosum]|eukprot:ORY45733.1 alpha/beta-hydrolase [Rhizoclosmatium globosum]
MIPTRAIVPPLPKKTTSPDPSREASNNTHFQIDPWSLAKTKLFPDIIQKWGTPAKHTAFEQKTTSSSPYSESSTPHPTPPTPKPPVLLWHGFGGTANCFVCASHRSQNLPFHLLSEFDVWLANSRGPLYADFESAGHRDFSIDEIVGYDIPAVVDHVLMETGVMQLNYIGISQGTTTIFGALAIHEELNAKIKCVIALAPTLKPCEDSISDVVFPLYRHVGSLIPAEMYMQTTICLRCVPVALSSRIVGAITEFGFKWDFGRLGSSERQAPLITHGYHGTSRSVVDHWLQTIQCETSFSQYKKSESSVFSHTVGNSEYRAVEKEPTTTNNVQRIPGYTHFEFLWATDASTKVFDPIIDLLQLHNQ